MMASASLLRQGSKRPTWLEHRPWAVEQHGSALRCSGCSGWIQAVVSVSRISSAVRKPAARLTDLAEAGGASAKRGATGERTGVGCRVAPG